MSSETDRVEKQLFYIKLRPIPKLQRRSNEPSKSSTPNTKHCWECYKSNAFCDCTICENSFHIKCLSIKYEPALWTCPECKLFNLEQTKIRSSHAEVQNLNEHLQKVHINLELEDCINIDLMPIVQKHLSSDSDISHALNALESDQKSIKKNLNAKKYQSVNKFSLDMKAMIFKFFIALDFSDEQYTELHNWSKKLLDRCREDIQCLELCVDCFTNLCTNEVDWFATVCSSRHRVVLANHGKYPLWPAKVMLEENDFITVQFFGDHSTARVMRNKVLPFSRKELNKKRKYRNELNECLPELNQYLENLGHGNSSHNDPSNAQNSDESMDLDVNPSDPFNSTFNQFKSKLTNQYKVHLKRSLDLEKQNESLEIELKRVRIEFSKVEQEKAKLSTDINRLEDELEVTKRVKIESAQADKYDEFRLKIAKITAERDEYKKKLDKIEFWKKRGDELWQN